MKKKDSNEIYRKLKLAYSRLGKAFKELKESHIEMIFRLAFMAELRDPETGGHLVRIADYSAIIAEGMGLPKDEIDMIRHASPMHDVGKIMLPDKILKKKGKLTAQEKDLMKKHPSSGAEIFKNSRSSLLKACEEIALTHHERYDGTGYPMGLSGKDIPLYGRIVALADCFDAYTSARSYKKAYTFDEAVAMIRERSGTHFDPAVVRAFVKNKNKIKTTLEANRDIEGYLQEIEDAEKDSKAEKAEK